MESKVGAKEVQNFLNIVVPYLGYLTQVAGYPFFIVTLVACISAD